jgi:predicted transposase YdaD
MFKLHDIRESKVWRDAYQAGFKEGFKNGFKEGRTIAQCDLVRKCLARGMSIKEIAELMELSVQTIRRLARSTSK